MNDSDKYSDNDSVLSDLSAQSSTFQLPTVVPTSISHLPQPERGSFSQLGQGGLNPALTFDRFVVGGSNRETYQAAMEVSDVKKAANIPLIIYGGVGLGKTHLLHAIGNKFSGQSLDRRVYCISSETFLHDCLHAIAHPRKYEALQQWYRNIDLLLIDDLHLLTQEPRIQEEFGGLLNHLSQQQRRLVCTCDRPPEFLDEFLSTSELIENHSIIEIHPPEFELRVSILQHKLQERDSGPVPLKVLHYLARHLTQHIRQLEGALNRLMAEMRLGANLNMRVARRVIAGSEPENRPANAVTLEAIQEAVARYFHITLSELCSRKRAKRFTLPRQVGMYLARQLTPLSLKQISSGFGHSHHSTVVRSCQRIESLLQEDLFLTDSIEALKTELTRNNTK